MSDFNEFLRLRIILPIAERINGTCASYWLRQIEEMNTWSRERIVNWQEEKLQEFIHHAYEHTTYYHRLFDSLDLSPTDIRHIEDLKKLPILTKETIRAHYSEFIPDDLDTIPHRKDKTGGTTGEPMNYLTDENVWGYITASKIYSWRKCGYRYGDKFAALGSASLFNKKPSLKRRVYDWIRQEKPMNSMNLPDDLCKKYFERMREEHIHFLYGYASSIYLMAQYAAKHKEDVSFIKGVFTTSENLTESYRTLIESVFGCRVMDSYGARDAGITAFETLPGVYPVSYNVIPELIGVKVDGCQTLISTSFLNNAFPLIRYEFGDLAAINFSSGDHNGPIITKVLGRVSDLIFLDNGHILTAPGYTILMNRFDVIAYRIVKINGREVKMQIQPIPGKFSDVQSKELQKEMQRFIGEDCKFTLELVNGFDTLPNGKRGFFLN